MSLEISTQEESAYLRITLKGEMTLESAEELGPHLFADGKFLSARRLYDLRECVLKADSAQLKVLANQATRYNLEPSKVALLVLDDLSFGLSRMYEAIRSADNIELNVFKMESAAIDWLTD